MNNELRAQIEAALIEARSAMQYGDIYDKALAALRAEPDVQPVAYRLTNNLGNGRTHFGYVEKMEGAYLDNCLEVTPLYAAPTQSAPLTDVQPVAWCVCKHPETVGVRHRTDGPCYHIAAPQSAEPVNSVVMRWGHPALISNPALILESDQRLYLAAPTQSAVPQWQPIETAPTDNKRPLLIARFNNDGSLQNIDHNASLEWERESWELPQEYQIWCSENGYVEEPTHWMYQPDWYTAAPMAAQGGE